MAETDSTTLPTPIPTPLNVTAQAKRHGVARSTIQRRLKKGWTPTAEVPLADTSRKRRKPRNTMLHAAPRATLHVQLPAAPHATPDAAPVALHPPVPHQVPDHILITAATLVAALALATCSAAFSISGLTSIFAGAFWPVIGLGVAFELGKVSAVAWLGQRNGAAPLRLALAAVVAVLMALNSVGVYGFLSRAHLKHALAGDLSVASRAADVEARLAVQPVTSRAPS